jgi:ComF family protein
MVYGISLGRLIADRCPGCDGVTDSGFCSGCQDDFVRIDNACGLCGLGRPVVACPRNRHSWHLDHIIAPFDYVDPLRSQVQRLKFGGQRRLGRALGELLASALVAAPETRSVDALVAVPLHRRRLLERGYNQAFELARPVAAALGVPLLRRGITRLRATVAQSSLPARSRYTNLRGAFRVERELRDQHLGIVDDVLTTGATLNGLASALKAAGARRVDGWTIARALLRQDAMM